MKKGKDGIYNRVIKRILDFLISLCVILVLSPLLIVLTILGAIKMKGNPFFTQQRPGRNEKIFKLIKFRTMTNEKDEKGHLLPDEVRLNAYGKFLRSTSCDELPELFNILKGDMSIIGPRPWLVKYLPLYTAEQHHRHDVRPGLTGWAQIHGRNCASWAERLDYDLEYVNNVSFAMDVKTILLTVKAVLKREGISSETSATMEEFKGTEK